MTVTTGSPDVGSVVRALSDANVQFVVVGQSDAGSPLRVVVSKHPTNLEALGRALDRLDASLRALGELATASAEGHASGTVDDDPPEDLPRRVGDPLGTIAVTTSAGDVDLIFGGPRRSLYAEVASHAQERKVGGLSVQWTDALPAPEPAPRVTSKMLGRRLLSIAEGLAHLIERHDESANGDGGAGD
jgi:hypothetical protein